MTSAAERLTAVAVPDDEVLATLHSWLPHQRWYPAKGTTTRLARVGVVGLPDPARLAEVGLHLFRLPWGGVLQVPVVLRQPDGDEPQAGAEPTGGVIGTAAHGGRQVLVVDGCHDPAFVRAWLAAAHQDVPLRPDPGPGAHRVLTGEQSNTSVLLPTMRPPGILKVFRAVSPGPNPDVEVPLALHAAGWTGAPRPYAWLEATWPDRDAQGGTQAGHLGVLSELVLGARDGFELACELAAGHTPFDDLAEALGRTTAQMHTALRTALPAAGGDRPADPALVLATLRARAAAAVAAAPVLQTRAAAIDEVLVGVTQVGALPPVQRVHGDYHLGQVLRGPDAWAVLDFEGEPSASAQERSRPDLPLRDLAGMLRSIDYAAAVGGATDPSWAAGARAALVAGYVAEAGGDAASAGAATVLRALELDKAVYEVVYEVRNRPDWVPIPLAGVDRLI